ncbi:receptor protein kinase-like protein At4g34220 [Miscanthus floridulus]|uniref:receptor protein kinase-like protein At4g34220 n=1 Tax=Miscanthus floridulus TaxID=154761 RepID=UPI0034590AAA
MAGGGAVVGAVGWLLLLLLASLCARSHGLNADGVLLMAFKNAVTADPLGTLLSGTLPPDLGRIEHLLHLDLSGNSLSGGLPATLLNATELRVLSLAGNAIFGELPDTGATAYALTGRLPAALCRLPCLIVLGLASNRFAGELPIGGLGTLELVDLSGNGFNGSLPSDFGGGGGHGSACSTFCRTSSLRAVSIELAALVPANATVDLSRNNFTSAIPQDGPFAAQPATAYEGNPNLCGPPLKQACSIPSSLSNPPNATDSPPAFAAIPKNPARAPPGAPRQPWPSISRTRGS